MAFLHVENHQEPLHLLPSPPPCSGGGSSGNHLITLDLFHLTPSPSNFHIYLLHNYYTPISFTFDHKVSDQEEKRKMSRRNGNGQRVELKLNLSPPARGNPHVTTPSRSATVSPTSPPSSCVSSEANQEDGYSSSSPEASSMVLVGCPRCLMYVMLSQEDPRCPKCKSTVLLDVLQHHNSNSTTTAKN